MSRNLRNKTRISYQELDEPPFDEYLYCDNCNDFVYEYCSIHGPLLVIPDNKMDKKHSTHSSVPMAAFTIPHVFLHLAKSTIPGAGIGVFSTLTLPRGVRFGPYHGQKTYDATSDYCWLISDSENRPLHVLDAADGNKSNWMRYVNCARHWKEQNLLAYQYRGQIYYRTIKIIPRFTELLVFYGSEFAHSLNIDLRHYNSPNGYHQMLIISDANKETDNNTTQQNSDFNAMIEENYIAVEEKCAIVSENSITDENSAGIEEKDTIADENTIMDTDNCELKYKHETVNFNDENNNMTSSHFICDICGYTTEDKELLITHIHSSTFKCNKCDFRTVIHSYLKKHYMLHRESRKFVCDICSYRFQQSYSLIRHKKSHFSDGNVKEKNLTVGYKIKKGKEAVECPICKNLYNSRKSLNRHAKVHKGVTPFICHVCSAEFKYSVSLMFHLKYHVTESITEANN